MTTLATLAIFVTALLIGSFALAIIYLITQTSNETIKELQLDIEDLELDKTNLESRVNSLCKMIEVQDKLLQEFTEAGHQIEVIDPVFESNKPI